jgi:Fic/DOC family
MTPIVYLTVDQVKELHRDAIEQFGGADGIRAEQHLYSALAQVQQSAFGEDAYPTVPEKAAAYGYFLSQNHPFLDGTSASDWPRCLPSSTSTAMTSTSLRTNARGCSKISAAVQSIRANSSRGSAAMPAHRAQRS